MSRSSKQAIVGMAVFAAVLTTDRGDLQPGQLDPRVAGRRALRPPGRTRRPDRRDRVGAGHQGRVALGADRLRRRLRRHARRRDRSCVAPLTQDVDATHAFEFIGVSTISARVITGGCGAGTETVEAIRTIEIKPLRR